MTKLIVSNKSVDMKSYQIKAFIELKDFQRYFTCQNQIQIAHFKSLSHFLLAFRANSLPSRLSQLNKMDLNSGEDSIQVFIRIKPNSQQQGVLAYTDTQIRLDKHQFAFDKIFPPTATQNDVFHHVGNKLLNNVLDGYNSCVFVYGQTGSGKTHTMIGENNGLMQQSFNQLFSRINRMKNAQCLVTCSYFELYNEQIMDLMDPKKQKKLNIRQDAKRGVFVQNLTEQTALDCEKLMDVLYTGMKNRHIGETQMNRQSSRSHSVFTISLSCKMQEDGKKILKTPKLHFVDLAGSQRQKMTQASGDRLKEAGNINKSLTTLGMVINALTSEKPRSHIPYRDSKLTCLLRDSLGGNSKTIIVAAVSSVALSFQQTLSTLNFANRAKMVKVKALINEESLSSNIEVFKEQIRRLKAEIMRLKTQHHRTPIKVITQEVMSPKQIGNELEQHFQEINKKISAISDQISQGITSPSLQALLKNLNGKKSVASTQTMMEEENSEGNGDEMDKCSPTEFIEYLNSNYELLSQINTKINEYVGLKEELRHAALNKKLSIQSMLTPSKFQRDQYEQLLVRRQREIQELEEKVQEIQSNLSQALLQKKDYQRKLELYQENKSGTSEQLQKIRTLLIEKEYQIEKEKGQSQKLKTQMMRIQKSNHELEQRFKETKQLHLYAQEKYQNQRFTTSKLSNKIQELQREITHLKKLLQSAKEQKNQIQNELENIKLLLEDRESREEELKNELTEMEETLQFNKKMIEDLTKKNLFISNQAQKTKQAFDQLTIKNAKLNEQNSILRHNLQEESVKLTRQLEQKSLQLKQSHITNERLTQQLEFLSAQLKEQKQKKQAQFHKNREQVSELKRLLNEKESQLMKALTQMHLLQDSLDKIKNQNTSILQNFTIKYEAKIIECNMFQQNLKEYKHEAETLIEHLKKQICTHTSQIQSLTSSNLKLQQNNQQLQSQLTQAQKKLASVQQVFEENEQFKKSYKELVKENYRLKGKYQNFNQNQELQKQKNDELLSKVQFYEEKFKLMSIQYQKIQGIVKKLKEKELQANKKIQFYEENIKLMQIEKSTEDSEEKNHLIRELKQENRELKYKLDTLQGNMIQSSTENVGQNDSNNKKSKEERESLSLSIKEEKFRAKLGQLMKNWEGFGTRTQEQVSTEDMIDLCEVMLNENAIKFETIAKGIRREQKLKSQNHFILKENIYLKERVEQLEKKHERSFQKQKQQAKPRKLVKTD